jgi:hypothetical protein
MEAAQCLVDQVVFAPLSLLAEQIDLAQILLEQPAPEAGQSQ